MRCPRCGSEWLHAVSEVETDTKIKGFGCCKGGIGAILFGPIGWLCGLCGMGKGRTKTTSTTLWMCDGCGKRFR